MRIAGKRGFRLPFALAGAVGLTSALAIAGGVALWCAGLTVGVAVIFAVIDRRALRAALRELAGERYGRGALQGRLDAAAATSDGWLYTLDVDSRFIYSSDASLGCLGYTPQELLGTAAADLLSPDEIEVIDTRPGPFPRAVNVLVVRGRHRNGEDRWFECSIAEVLDARTHAGIGWTGTARPLTDAKHPRIFREIHRRAVADIVRTEDLTIAFQPIHDLATGQVAGVEALSRFASRSSVTPDVVFAEAANAGLGPELELLAVRRALAEARVLHPSLHIALNVSPSVLASPSLIETIVASGMELSRIVVEITEHVSITDYSVLAGPRQRLRELGIRLAVDDAGSGYASLRHILTLAPDVIKIDRALVTDLNNDRARRALVSAVVTFAKEMGVTSVIGEGVETQAELDALLALGVDAAQGYFLGRPTATPTDWTRWGRPLSLLARGATHD
jgi:PAS domain S-box-containing protein